MLDEASLMFVDPPDVSVWPTDSRALYTLAADELGTIPLTLVGLRSPLVFNE